MRKRISIKASCYHYLTCLMLLPFILSLYGCPYSSAYKLDSEPSLYADETLVGKWATLVTTYNGDQQPVKLIIEKLNDNEYGLAITGSLNFLSPYIKMKNDTIRCTAFMSLVADRKFLNIITGNETYITQAICENNKLSILPLAEKFTSKYIRSNRELRAAVEIHFRNRVKPVYDDDFCLWNMVRVN